jgi:predicted DNA-binding transcriptional regulator AlpA
MENKAVNYHLIDSLTLSSITGIKHSTLRHWRCQKKGPEFLKLGSKVMYRSDEIERWLASNTVSFVNKPEPSP